VVNALVRDGVITEQEKNGYIDERGYLTSEAKDRIGRMIVGRLFESPAEFRQTPPELRGKLERVAPQVLRVEGREGWAITDQVRKAVTALQDARVHGIRNLEDLARQTNLNGQTRNYPPDVLAIAKKLQEGPLAAQRAFRMYANDEALSREGAQTSMFEPPTQREAFDAAFKGSPATYARPYDYVPHSHPEYFGQAQSRYKRLAGGGPGIVLMNRPALEMLNQLNQRLTGTEVQFMGVAFRDPRLVPAMVRVLRESANLPSNATHQRPMRQLSDSLEQAWMHDRDHLVTAALHDRSVPLKELFGTMREELHHRESFRIGDIESFPSKLRRQRELRADERYRRAALNIMGAREYLAGQDAESTELEVMAHIAAGEHPGALGLTQEEAHGLYNRWAEELYREHGERALPAILRAYPQLRRDLLARFPPGRRQGSGPGTGGGSPLFRPDEGSGAPGNERLHSGDQESLLGHQADEQTAREVARDREELGQGSLFAPERGERGSVRLGAVSLGLDRFVEEDVAPRGASGSRGSAP
jgi:hypothetical protein